MFYMGGRYPRPGPPAQEDDPHGWIEWHVDQIHALEARDRVRLERGESLVSPSQYRTPPGGDGDGGV